MVLQVMTDDAYKHINKLGEKYRKGVEDSIRRHGIKAVVPGKSGPDVAPGKVPLLPNPYFII